MAKKNNIRGITIEINGDVTKLDKALSQVDKNLAATQKSLKEVDRLLKFDPRNTELLTQKQQLLNRSTEELRKGLDAVNKALDGATTDPEALRAWESAEKSLNDEIVKTQNEITELTRRQKEFESLGFKRGDNSVAASIDELSRAIEKAREKEKGLNDELAITYERLGKPMTQEGFDELIRKQSQYTEQLKNAERAAAQFNPTLAALSGTMDQVSQSADSFAKKTAGISAAAGVAAAGLLGLAANAAKTADDLNTLSQQSGFSTAFLQAVEYAADRVDVSSEAIISSMRKLKKNIFSDSKDVQAAFAQLNIIPEQLVQSGASVDAIFRLVTEALSHVGNELERDNIAMALFGRSADELAGIIDDGGASFRAFQQEAQDLGLILSQESLDAANALGDVADGAKARLKASLLEAGAALAESLIPTLESFVAIAEKVLNWISNLDAGTLKIMLTITALIAIISPVAKLISNVTGAISGVSSVASLFSATAGNSIFLTFAKWALVITAVVAAITLLIAAIAELTGKGEGLRKTFQSYGSAGGGGIPGLAGGAVVEPNNPMLAWVGDNPREREIIAPYSTIVEGVRDGIRQSGSTNTQVPVNVVKFTGTDQEIVRALGPKLETYWSDRGAVI